MKQSKYRKALPQLGDTVETDGRLPSSQPLGKAIGEVDADPSGGATLDMGDPVECGRDDARLVPLLPNLRGFGGCCGTDHRLIHEIGHTCIPAGVI